MTGDSPPLVVIPGRLKRPAVLGDDAGISIWDGDGPTAQDGGGYADKEQMDALIHFS